jgi:hypothetical protein
MGQAAGAAAAILCKTHVTTETHEPEKIRKHLLARGVILEE